MILDILLGVVVLYLLIGAAMSYIAISFMLKTKDSDFASTRQRWQEYSLLQKIKSVVLGMFIWLPAALGIKRSHFFK